MMILVSVVCWRGGKIRTCCMCSRVCPIYRERMYCTDCRREANPGREWLKLELISLYHFFKLMENHIVLLTHIIKSLKLITTNT